MKRPGPLTKRPTGAPTKRPAVAPGKRPDPPPSRRAPPKKKPEKKPEKRPSGRKVSPPVIVYAIAFVVILILVAAMIVLGPPPREWPPEEFFPWNALQMVLFSTFLVWPVVGFWAAKRKKVPVAWAATIAYIGVSFFGSLQLVVFGGIPMLVGAFWLTSR